MTDSQAAPEPDPINSEELVRSLRRKQGTWVDWGKACQQLQKAGYSPQKIFEETGFEPIQQNQIIVASQVYTSLVNGEARAKTLEHFQQRGSDSLYELRILSQAERVATAELLVEKGIDSEGAREIAKAVKETSYLSRLPEGFSDHSGDAVAYQCWKSARQTDDLQERSRLIARGLQFAHTATARQQLEKLLTDFTVVQSQTAPRLPVYRLETEEEMPRILPVVGKFPLTKADLQAVPLVEEAGPFKIVRFAGEGAWVTVPGWQVILRAEDPVVLLCDSQQLPSPLPGKSEEVLAVVDRAQRQWRPDSYFLADTGGQLALKWFDDTPNVSLLGRLLLVMRPKKVLDEAFTQELWQIDE